MSYLQMKGISKFFPGVQALKSVDFGAAKGEVHAIAGENGAGKSTLIKILSGAYMPDAGQIFLDSKEVKITGPLSGRQQGISVIYQELSLIPYLSVAENIFLGNMPHKLGAVNWKEMRQRSEEALQEIGFDIRPTALIKDLSIVQQQGVEIAKVMSGNAKIVVMDEPTALLPAKEVETLFRVINTLREKGVTILYISHRLNEIFEMADQVTVLKDGAKVGTVRPADITQEDLVQMMIGRKASERSYVSNKEIDATVVLEVQGISNDQELKDVSLSLHKGEILGIAGLVGSGKSEAMQCIFGGKPITRGSVNIRGQNIERTSPAASIKNSLGYLPADRKNQGLVLGNSIRENATLASLNLFSKRGVINKRKEVQAVKEQREKLRIKCHSLEQPVGTLSGGNQQKVVMAKWLLPECDVLLFDEPTRGIDVGARAEIYELMSTFARNGGAIIVASSDTQELLAVADNIIVMGQGQVTGSFTHAEATEEKIVRAMF